MSLITCCPACATRFKVVPDQLRISEGWVRCGHCTEVFDAAAHLQAAPPAQAAPGETPESDSPDEPPHGRAAAAEGTAAPREAFAAEEPMPSGLGLIRADASEAALAEHGPAAPDGADADADAVPEPEPEPEHADVSFVRQAQRQAYWQRRGVRVLLAGAALALTVLLAGQFAFHGRDRLAATRPELRPWLELLCQVPGCRIATPRDIEALAIDSSSFNKLGAEAYRLNFTLKNQGPLAVAMPALELTLTDSQDQVMLRRVLVPADFDASAAAIAPGAEWPGSLALNVHPDAGADRIAGYRLLAFYP